MISRRTFVSTSVAASAATLIGSGKAPDSEGAAVEAPRADAKLRIYFVGGTVFANDRTHYTAVQLSGYNQEHGGHKLDHASFIVAPKGRLEGAAPLPPAGADLHPHLADPTKFETRCLVGSDVLVNSTDGSPIKYKCKKVAHYGHIASGWTRKEPWTPGLNKPVNSRFTLIGGELDDEKAVNTNGARVEWWVKDKTKKKFLSDVVFHEVDAGTITISGLNPAKIVLTSGDELSLYVFAGPLSLHGPNHKYKTLSHAYLLTTIYNVGTTPIYDILPTTENEVEGMEHRKIPNPCKQDIVVPPDSEYCVNYDELP